MPEYAEGEEPCYIVFESISVNTSKVIHVVNMLHTEEIKLGRGHDADVRVTDISVTRTHAKMRKSNKGYFIIDDNKSKFGTLALIRNPLLLSQTDPNIIQAGRTLVEITIRRPIKLLDSCFCGGITNNNQNKRLSIGKSGLATKNGVDFFPEEFLPDKKKILKKSQSEIRQRAIERNMQTAM